MSDRAADRRVPSAGSVLVTLVGVTWRRLSRSRAVWVCGVIAALPVLSAGAFSGSRHHAEIAEVIQYLVLILLPPVFVAASLGEEIEDRTTTYLWSRPLARWTIVIGKFVALAPIAAVLVGCSWAVAVTLGTDHPPPMASVAAFACGAVTIAAMSAGLATIVPKHAMALAIVFLVVFDLPVSALPASLRNLSITYQVRHMSGLADLAQRATPMMAMAMIAAFWLAIALWRIRRLES